LRRAEREGIQRKKRRRSERIREIMLCFRVRNRRKSWRNRNKRRCKRKIKIKEVVNS